MPLPQVLKMGKEEKEGVEEEGGGKGKREGKREEKREGEIDKEEVEGRRVWIRRGRRCNSTTCSTPPWR